MRWLHLVRNGGDAWVAGLVRHQAERGLRPTVVLLHDAVAAPLPVPDGVPVLLRRADAERHGIAGRRTVDETEILRLLDEHERAVVW